MAGMESDLCDFRRMGRVQTGIVGMEILRRAGSSVESDLKKTTSEQVWFLFCLFLESCFFMIFLF